MEVLMTNFNTELITALSQGININEIIKSEKKLKKRVFIREALVENISMIKK